MATLVDAFAIPHAWKNAAILEEEAGRQEAMAARDAELRAAAARRAADNAPDDTATSVDVPPGQ